MISLQNAFRPVFAELLLHLARRGKKETQQLILKSNSFSTDGRKLARGTLTCLTVPGALWQCMLVRERTHSL